jgi:hypothetical protein
VGCAVVDTDRFVRARARHSRDTAARASRRLSGRQSGAAPSRLGPRRSNGRLRWSDGNEILARDRIFVFLAEKALLNEHIKSRWRRVCVFSLEETDGARVLLTSKDQFLFLFALRELLPDRHRHGQHHGHDAHGDDEHRHRVTAFGLTS